MLLGAEDAPNEINGVGAVHDWAVRGAELGQYITGGFAGAGGGTGFKVNAVLLLMSKGLFDAP